jgi:membrane-bound lytic murein transglycosylase MltF
MNRHLGKLRVVLSLAMSLTLIVLMGCGKKEVSQEKPAPAAGTTAREQTATPQANQEKPGAVQVTLPAPFGRSTDDLDAMLKRRNIRALVFMNPIGFFYSKGQPMGVMYEALRELETFVNQKMKTGTLKVKVTFIPVRPDQAEAALTQGVGDMIAYGLIVTPEREQKLAFTVPLEKDVKEVVVCGLNFGTVSSVEELGGKEIYANPLSVAYQSLQQLNEKLKKEGKTQIVIKDADKYLLDDDLVQMVNGGLIPATVTRESRAKLWSQVLPNLTVHPDLVVASGEQTAWAMRKDNPQLKQLLDEFITPRAVGTSFGNTLVRRYLQNTKWVKDSTSAEEMKKYAAMVAFFQKYAGQYGFDYLMIAAQGYQESLLDQKKHNPSGAVGIMQVIPKYAAASPINVPNVNTAENNIQAGVKMLRNIEDQYFNDPALDPVDKTLMVFASYNGGPNRIARLRKQAASEGLDPNKWFGNVELMVAKDIGQETVTYVSNIYKYYVAYKLAVGRKEEQRKAQQGSGS